MEPEIILGNPEDYDGRVILYIVKADATNYINYMKPLILARELNAPHILSVIDSTSEWYYEVHPERYVPALRDQCPDTGRKVYVFESRACLEYLASRFDITADWTGRNAWEKAQVASWNEYMSSGLGPTAKYWLYFLRGYPSRQNPEPQLKTADKLKENVLKNWRIVDNRLAQQGQQFIALPDRPTIADINFLPFCMPWMFSFFGQDIKDGSWKHIDEWAQRMLDRQAVKKVLEDAPSYGH